jgi:hypothetical protein
MNTELRVVTYQGKRAYFHQWLKKTNDEEQYRCEHSYALIELEDGTLREVSFAQIKFDN